MESLGDETIMKYRPLGRTGWMVSEISFGAWAIGGAWGHVSEKDALAALQRAVDSGVNFIDTADVYGDGSSERLIADLKKGPRKRSSSPQKPVVVCRARRLKAIAART